MLNDFAKADAEWLNPLLDAIAKSAGRIAKGDQARFLTDVARLLGSDPSPTLVSDKTAELPEAAKSRHPAGERQGKSQSAIAENIKKWLANRTKQGD